MKIKILNIVLGVCLVGAIGWGFTNYKEVGELKQTEMQLRMEIAEQREEVDHWKSEWDWQRERAFSYEDEIVRLEGELEYLNKELAEGVVINLELKAENNRLERQARSLSESLEEWKTTYDDLLANRDRWVTAYNDLLAKHNQLNEQLKDADYLQYLLQLLLF